MNWMNVVDKDFPKIKEVTKTMVLFASNQSLQIRGCVRLATGRISTTKNLEDRRNQLIKDERKEKQNFKEYELGEIEL
jgi:hypothetical protein